MKKAQQATRVRAISDYLEGIGHSVTHVQCYEILARALGLKNKHVLAQLGNDEPSPTSLPSTVVIGEDTVPVRPQDAKPFTIAEMTELEWSFDFVIPIALDDLEDIEAQNNAASKFLTGDEYALENLRYEHVPEVQYDKGYVAYRVQAYVSNPEDIFDEVRNAADALFYTELLEFAGRLKEDTQLCFSMMALDQARVLRNVSPELVDLLKTYAQSAGGNNDAVNARGEEIAFELHCFDGAVPEAARYVVSVPLSSLKYASKESDHTWHVSVHNLSAHLVFNA
jgi:hypothetical protein